MIENTCLMIHARDLVYKIVPPIRDRTYGVTAVRAIQSEVNHWGLNRDSVDTIQSINTEESPSSIY